jgi:hypothetical protein
MSSAPRAFANLRRCGRSRRSSLRAMRTSTARTSPSERRAATKEPSQEDTVRHHAVEVHIEV